MQSMTRSSRRTARALAAGVVLYLLVLAMGWLPHGDAAGGGHEVVHADVFVPSLWAVSPFVFLLLAIAILPLVPSTAHWWESNRSRFLVAAFLGGVTLAYYGLLHPGGVADHFAHRAASTTGLDTVIQVFNNAILVEYVPFIVLLFSLYVISGGINLRGDLPAHPSVNSAFIALGTVLASFIGTTGAAMMLIRPLLTTNRERRHKVHTVIFFIFMTCNCGGLLLPIGDPPLFLGYLRGVPFTWTLKLWPYWLTVNLLLLLIYYVWDRVAYAREPLRTIIRDEAEVRPLKLTGLVNIPLLLAVVLSVAFLVPGRHIPGTPWEIPIFIRETVMILLVIASLLLTRAETRLFNRFDYHAILEVAALFSGIFVCMQVPIEILHARGAELGLNSAAEFFWTTGILSSFLDNAPTYVVFFETAVSLPASTAASAADLVHLAGGRVILEALLIPISLGAVFMGANSYIGNGPNFMVKSIAEQSGVKMPSFFGYMAYSMLILVPVWVLVSVVLHFLY